MGLKVLKFGGSSVADATQLSKIKDIIQKDPERRYVVVSAPGKRSSDDTKITDLLYMCKAQRDHNLPWEESFRLITDRYSGIRSELGIDVDLESHYRVIHDNLEKGCSQDYIVSRGEYL